MFELRLLGEIHLRRDDGTEVDELLRQPKRLALLAYLASPCPGTWHRRDMLLALFWPDLDASHARTSLRNGLYVLRQILGDEILLARGDEEIAVDPKSLSTDLSIVWEALRAGRPEDALANYRGELLSGLYPPDAQGFDRWVDSERVRLKTSLSTSAMARVAELESEKKFAEALSIVRKVSEINPDDETIVRRMMTIHESMGDRRGGLTVFESYRLRLSQDYDAEPSPETLDVATRLRSSSYSPPPRGIKMASANASNVGDHYVDFRAAPLSELPPRNFSRIALIAAMLVVAVIGVAALRRTRESKPQTIGRGSPVTSDEGLQVEAAISPNGRLVAFAKGNANKLRIFVQRLDGGEAWPLSNDTTNVQLMPRWSPDNDRILFLSRNNAYAAPTIGGSPLLIARGGEGDAMIRSASWSPTGDSLALVRNDSLYVQSTNGTGARFIGKGFQLHSCVWAPQGKWIACVSGNWIAFTPGPLFGNDAPSSVLLFSLAGGNPVALTNADNESSSPSWSADGKHLWILSNKDGARGQTYAVPIGEDGRPSGEWIRAGVGAESISLAADRIAYSIPTKKANAWSIPIPSGAPVSVAGATEITSGNQVIELLSASRDGKWLIYDSNLRGNADIYRVSITGGTPEALTTDPRAEYAPEISPDGTEFVWQRWVGGMRHLFVKKIDADAEYEIVPDSGDQGVPRWSADGRKLVAWSHNNERGAVFVVPRNARGQWQRPSWRLDYGQLPVWSPDDKSIAFVKLDGSIQSIPADSGEVTTLYRPRPGTSDPLATFLVWSKDPNVIYALGGTSAGQGIWSVSIKTGRPTLLVKLDDPIDKSIGPAFSSDGSRFYFALSERFSNVSWAELSAH